MCFDYVRKLYIQKESWSKIENHTLIDAVEMCKLARMASVGQADTYTTCDLLT